MATLIPFVMASGLVAKDYPKIKIPYLLLMAIGFVSIAATKIPGYSCARFIYPTFHAISGLTIFLVPLLVVKAEKAPASYMLISLGGALMSLGGVALSFLKADKQLLFLSWDVVLMILAPMLFFTALFFALGLHLRKKSE